MFKIFFEDYNEYEPGSIETSSTFNVAANSSKESTSSSENSDETASSDEDDLNYSSPDLLSMIHKILWPRTFLKFIPKMTH